MTSLLSLFTSRVLTILFRLLGRLHRLHSSPVVGDVGGLDSPGRAGHIGHIGGEPRLVLVDDPPVPPDRVPRRGTRVHRGGRRRQRNSNNNRSSRSHNKNRHTPFGGPDLTPKNPTRQQRFHFFIPKSFPSTSASPHTQDYLQSQKVVLFQVAANNVESGGGGGRGRCWRLPRGHHRHYLTNVPTPPSLRFK